MITSYNLTTYLSTKHSQILSEIRSRRTARLSRQLSSHFVEKAHPPVGASLACCVQHNLDADSVVAVIRDEGDVAPLLQQGITSAGKPVA